MQKLLAQKFNLENTEIQKLEGYDSENYRIKNNAELFVLQCFIAFTRILFLKKEPSGQ